VMREQLAQAALAPTQHGRAETPWISSPGDVERRATLAYRTHPVPD
jgi:hypothetical protein